MSFFHSLMHNNFTKDDMNSAIKFLKQKNINHEVLNAKNHAREAEIIAQAGQSGVVTIATNMAGRGTDIVLGGNWETKLQNQEGGNNTSKENLFLDWQEGNKKVIDCGGLHVIGTERNESRRIDNQLRGRSGRQGDPGSSRFYLSLEDSLMRIFARDQVKNMMQGLGLEAGESIEHRMLSGAIERAQKRVEGRNFDIRKMLLEYDDMANEQRQIIYSQRNSVLESEDISELLDSMRQTVIENEVSTFIPEQSPEQQWDIKGLEASIHHNFGLQIPVKDWLEKDSNLNEQDIAEKIYSAATASYKTKGNSIGTVMRDFEKQILLQIIDNAWKDHLGSVDYLRQGIGLRGYGSRNPKLEFRRESFGLFEELLENILPSVSTEGANYYKNKVSKLQSEGKKLELPAYQSLLQNWLEINLIANSYIQKRDYKLKKELLEVFKENEKIKKELFLQQQITTEELEEMEESEEVEEVDE